MADNETSSKTGMLGVLIGALIVILVGGGILLAMGALETKPTNVTITQPAATPAPAPAEPDRADRDRRRDDRRGEWRGDRDHDRDRDRDRDRDGADRR
jgi:hypothetical protein